MKNHQYQEDPGERFHDYTHATHFERWAIACSMTLPRGSWTHRDPPCSHRLAAVIQQTLKAWQSAGLEPIIRKAYNGRLREQPALVQVQAPVRHRRVLLLSRNPPLPVR